MDKMLAAIVGGPLNDDVKKRAVSQMVRSCTISSPEEAFSVLDLAWRWSLSEELFLCQLGWDVFLEVARRHGSELDAFLSSEKVESLFVNDARLHLNLAFLSSVLQLNEMTAYRHSQHIASRLKRITSHESLPPHTIPPLATLYKNLPLLWQGPPEELLQKAIDWLSKTDGTNLVMASAAVDSLTGLVKTLFELPSRALLQDHALIRLFQNLTSVEDVTPALTVILGQIPSDRVKYILSIALDQTSDDTMMRVLRRLTNWPLHETNVTLIVAAIDKLREMNKIEILLYLAKHHTVDVVRQMETTFTCPGAMIILEKILMGYQHSPDVFHSILPLLPHVLDTLSQSAETKEFVKITHHKLVQLILCQMYCHTGYPELYSPLLPKLAGGSPVHEDEMKSRLSELAWIKKKDIHGPEVHRVRDSELTRVGLMNLGNTCYMNVMLQALYHSTSFKDQILAFPPPSFTELGARVSAQLQRLFALMMFSRRASIAPREFMSVLDSDYRSGGQQDVTEFGRYLMATMEEELTKSTDNKDMVARSFGGKMRTTVRCAHCGAISKREEPFVDITLGLPPNLDTLDALLANQFSIEELTGDNQYMCDACHTRSDAQKLLSVSQAPEHLMISLNRMEYDLSVMRRKKILRPISYPLSLKVDCLNEQEHIYQQDYDLYGVIVHSGRSADAGHYYAFMRNSGSTDSAWMLFNDETVTPSNPSSFLNVSQTFPSDVPYILLYVKKTKSHTPLYSVLPDLHPQLIREISNDNAMFATERDAQERKYRLEQLQQQRRRQEQEAAWYYSGHRGGPDSDFNPGGFHGGFGGGGVF